MSAPDIDLFRRLLRRIARSLDRSSRDWDFGAMSPEEAYSAALGAVSSSIEEAVSELLRVHSDDDGAAHVKPVQVETADLQAANTSDPDGFCEGLDNRMVGRTKIDIPDIQSGEIRLVFSQEGGHLAIELMCVS